MVDQAETQPVKFSKGIDLNLRIRQCFAQGGLQQGHGLVVNGVWVSRRGG